VTGADVLGFYYGVGKFLHNGVWKDHEFIPNPPIGYSAPDCRFRTLYFSIHFYNWYQMAPVQEREDYLYDLVLWGYNTVHGLIPVTNINEIGDEVYPDSINRVRKLFTFAREIGMKTSLCIVPNQGLLSAPHAYD